MKASLGGPRKTLSLSRRSLTATAAITQPAEENFGDASRTLASPHTENGQQQASDIWAGELRGGGGGEGHWEGAKPVKKVLFSDVLYSPKRERS